MKKKVEYREFGFRVFYERLPHKKDTLTFAAHPYELMYDPKMNNDPNMFLVIGRVLPGEKLEVGFKAFSFEMTKDLHNRLGQLYDAIKLEYRKTILRKI